MTGDDTTISGHGSRGRIDASAAGSPMQWWSAACAEADVAASALWYAPARTWCATVRAGRR